MDIQISTIGALIGLAVAIILIIKKIQPAYGLIFGALIGGLIGGAGLEGTVKAMMEGAEGIMPAILRIVTAGILAGVLIQTGAAAKISEQIIKGLGEKRALFALGLSTMVLTAVGVFIDVAVITVAPIALALGRKLHVSKFALLFVMIGGGKAGNVISPNPNTIAVAENFNIELSSLMVANIIPALFGLAATIFVVKLLMNKGEKVKELDIVEHVGELPSFFGAIIGPVVTIGLLALRPLAGIAIDPLIALPVGGIIGCVAMGKVRQLNDYMSYGLSKMLPVAVLLVGTGTIAGIIKFSTLQGTVVNLLAALNMPEFILAPFSGVLMSAATASTTAGATIASATFGDAITSVGISSLAGAAMVHAGATVLDHLPHGSFFHTTAGATHISLGERLKLIPYETVIGAIIMLVSTVIWGILI